MAPKKKDTAPQTRAKTERYHDPQDKELFFCGKCSMVICGCCVEEHIKNIHGGKDQKMPTWNTSQKVDYDDELRYGGTRSNPNSSFNNREDLKQRVEERSQYLTQLIAAQKSKLLQDIDNKNDNTLKDALIYTRDEPLDKANVLRTFGMGQAMPRQETQTVLFRDRSQEVSPRKVVASAPAPPKLQNMFDLYRYEDQNSRALKTTFDVSQMKKLRHVSQAARRSREHEEMLRLKAMPKKQLNADELHKHGYMLGSSIVSRQRQLEMKDPCYLVHGRRGSRAFSVQLHDEKANALVEDIFADPSGTGRVVVTDSANGCVKIFSNTGTYTGPLPRFTPQGSTPYSVDIDKAGQILVSFTGSDEVVLYDRVGRAMKAYPDTFRGLGCAKFVPNGPHGEFLVSDFDTGIVRMFSKLGHLVYETPDLKKEAIRKVVYMVPESAERFFLLDQHHAYYVDARLNVLMKWPDKKSKPKIVLKEPQSMEFIPSSKSLLICDTGNNCIHHVDAYSGHYRGVLLGSENNMRLPVGVSVQQSDLIHVAQRDGEVKVFDIREFPDRGGLGKLLGNHAPPTKIPTKTPPSKEKKAKPQAVGAAKKK